MHGHTLPRRLAGLLVPLVAVVTLLSYSGDGIAYSNQQHLADSQQQNNGDAACLQCHENSDLKVRLPSGEELSLYVDVKAYRASIHYAQGLTCRDCHPNIPGYPHPPLLATDRRDFSIGLYPHCRPCHEDQYRDSLDSIHARELAAGNFHAPICTDCHGYHDVTPVNKPRSRIPKTCAKCHFTIFEQYKKSVHGAALLDESNPDVPTCIDCHGVHHIENPLTAWFRIRSPRMCADCHTDPKRMAKYNISTDVLKTYVADFHGTTVELFAKQSPDQPTNKAVCYDCHGVHDIKRVTDPDATVVKQNLVKTCRKCHPDATANFPSAWVGHYRASPNRYAVVYYINLFYQILIPAVIGFFLLFIAIETFHAAVLSRFCRKQEHE